MHTRLVKKSLVASGALTPVLRAPLGKDRLEGSTIGGVGAADVRDGRREADQG